MREKLKIFQNQNLVFFFFGKENHENIKIQEESSEEMELNQVYF
jgi:hypothetical protein